MEARPGNEVNSMVTPSPYIKELAVDWMRTGSALYPSSIRRGSEHVQACFREAVKQMEDDPRFVRL
jgi:hypothetical protein